MRKKPLALIILDGFGYTPVEKGNAVKTAKTPNIDSYLSKYPHNFIKCSGMDVGLPDGQMGNSEVGHTNIGAGRIVYQELTRITKEISDGVFFENKALSDAVKNCKENNSALHIMGLLSDGGVHSHNTHLYALLELAKKNGINDVYVHCFLDGRDVPPTSGVDYIKELQEKINEIGVGKIASVMGRFYAMDRDNRWERVSKAYDAIAKGIGAFCEDPADAVKKSYDENITDEFVVPTVVSGTKHVCENDSIVFFNFRPDRAREITRTFVDKKFDGFDRDYFPVHYVCFTQYDATMPNVDIAFRPTSLDDTFGEYISKNGLKQLRIAETEKYAHVTFFFNGGVEKEYDGEDRALISSPKVATYDLKPEMSAYEVTEECVKRINSDKYDVIVLNFANCDMVGHTGVFDAAVSAVEAVDTCLGKVIDAILSKGGCAIVTADHGNAEQMLDEEGNVQTSHSTNVVPLILIGADGKELKPEGRLADIAPTMLNLLEIEKPNSMTGESMIL